MKKSFLCLGFILFSVMHSFALDKQVVKIQPSYQIPGQTYVPLTTPQLPVGVVNLKYDFTVDAKDKEHAVIDCLIKFPKYFDVKLMSCDGVQALSLEDDKTVAALTIYDDDTFNYCEFLIPQKNGGIGFVEFQANIGENLKGQDIPVEFSFLHYEKPFFLRWGTAIGIATGIAAGVVVGVLTFNPATGTAAGAAAGTATTAATATGLTLVSSIALGTGIGMATTIGATVVSYNVIKDTLQQMKKKYSSKVMNDSYKKFTLQIR